MLAALPKSAKPFAESAIREIASNKYKAHADYPASMSPAQSGAQRSQAEAKITKEFYGLPSWQRNHISDSGSR